MLHVPLISKKRGDSRLVGQWVSRAQPDHTLPAFLSLNGTLFQKFAALWDPNSKSQFSRRDQVQQSETSEIESQISIYENRLQQEMIKYNKMLKDNNVLRNEIKHLRGEAFK